MKAEKLPGGVVIVQFLVSGFWSEWECRMFSQRGGYFYLWT